MNAETKTGAPKTAVGISIGAVVVLLAANGSALFTSLQAGWDFVLRVTQQMPLGGWSVLLALALGAAVMGFLRRNIPEPERKDMMHLRMALIEVVSLASAFAVVFLLLPTLLGGIVGALCGLSVSVAYRVLAAAGNLLLDRLVRPQ